MDIAGLEVGFLDQGKEIPPSSYLSSYPLEHDI